MIIGNCLQKLDNLLEEGFIYSTSLV